MKLIPNTTDLTNMDCHTHSMFSPDSMQMPDELVAAVRRERLRGFIITDHVDIGHWQGHKQIDFDEYFRTWNEVRRANPDLTIYIGLEVGYDAPYVAETDALIKDLPFEYIVNSVHYWADLSLYAGSHFDLGKERAYSEYIEKVLNSLDVPYPFSTVGHFGMLERYTPYVGDEAAMSYAEFKPLMDEIIKKTLALGVRFEENTNMWNSAAKICQPRPDFLRAYKAAGGVRPVLSSDAHSQDVVGRGFQKAKKMLDGIFR